MGWFLIVGLFGVRAFGWFLFVFGLCILYVLLAVWVVGGCLY